MEFSRAQVNFAGVAIRTLWQIRNNEKPKWFGICDDEIWATVKITFKKGEKKNWRGVGCSSSVLGDMENTLLEIISK